MATSLSSHLSDLQALLRQQHDAPSWSRVLLVEETDITHGTRMKVPLTSLHEPPEFANRFDELARCGYAWINLVGNGVLDGALIVSVETPRIPTGISPDLVAVNVSGPTNATRGNNYWDLSSQIEVV